MDFAALALFTGALLVSASSPGPGVAALVARVLGRGTDGAIAFAAGMAAGDLVWLAAAVLGLAVIAEHFQLAFMAIKYAGAAYLLWLAWKLWRAPAQPQEIAATTQREKPLPLFLAGLAVMLGNPKVMVFYLALLPSLIDVGRVGLLAYFELAAVIAAVLTLVYGFYIGLAARSRALFRSARAIRIVNRITGTTMAGAAVAVATR